MSPPPTNKFFKTLWARTFLFQPPYSHPTPIPATKFWEKYLVTGMGYSILVWYGILFLYLKITPRIFQSPPPPPSFYPSIRHQRVYQNIQPNFGFLFRNEFYIKTYHLTKFFTYNESNLQCLQQSVMWN